MKTTFAVTLCLLLSLCTYAQQGNNWVFPTGKGLSFNTYPPTIFTVDSLESGIVGAISDSNGNLLFYGNSLTVFNKYHEGLKDYSTWGLIYTKEDAIVVPIPDSANKYYYLTSGFDGWYNNLTILSVIDMNTAVDSGAAISTSVHSSFGLSSPVLTPHANGKDQWVLANVNSGLLSSNHGCYAILFTSTGIDTTIANSTAVPYGNTAISNDGENVIIPTASYDSSGMVAMYYNFDYATGKIDSGIPIKLPIDTLGISQATAVEFSSNDKNIFVAVKKQYFTGESGSFLYEFRRENLSQAILLDTITTYDTGCIPHSIISLRRGPDDKIYGTLDYTNQGAYGSQPCTQNDTVMLLINNPTQWGNNTNISYFHVPTNLTNVQIPYFKYPPRLTFEFNPVANGCFKDTLQRIILAEDSGKYLSYTLYFGDGDSVVQNNPFSTGEDTFYHYYPAGTYTLDVNALDFDTLPAYSNSVEIDIYFSPEIHYSTLSDSAGCWDHYYTFSDSSKYTDNIQLIWGNGDTSYAPADSLLSSIFYAEDTFNFKYIASNANCTEELLGVLKPQFLPKPVVRLGIADTALCQDEHFILNDSNTDVIGRSTTWGDGLSDTLLEHIYTDTGTFKVFVTDTAMNSCINTDSILFAVEDIRLISAGALDFTQACEDVAMEYAYTFFNADSIIIDWGDGAYSLSNQFIDLVNHTYSIGMYNLKIITFNSECIDTIFGKPVELLPYPKAIASVADNKLCVNQDLTITNNSTGASSYKVIWGDLDEEDYPISTSEFIHTYNSSAILTAQVIAINSQKCADTSDIDVNVLSIPVADFSFNKDSGCRPFYLAVNNKSTNYTSYFLNWGEGATETGATMNSFNHNYLNKGVYNITLGVDNGYCADTTYGSIKVNGLAGTDLSSVMVATINGPKSIYIEWEPLEGASGYTLSRSIDGVNYAPIAKNISTTNYFDNISTQANSWYYKVQAIDSCDNLSTEGNIGRTIYLEGEIIGKNEAAFLTWNPYEDWTNGVLVYQLEVTDAYGNFYTLTSQDSLTNKDTGFLDITREKKCYQIVAYEAGGNNSVSTSNTICLPYKPILWAPSSFSPNGDGYNDTWGVMHLAMEEISFTIYNRWGEIVYKSQYPTDTWDGKNALIGVYMYIIKGKAINGKPFQQWGEITLVR